MGIKQMQNDAFSAESRIRLHDAMEKLAGGSYAIAIDTNRIGGPPKNDPDGFQFASLGRLRRLDQAGFSVLTTSVWQLEALRHLQLTIDARSGGLHRAALALGRFGVAPFSTFAADIAMRLPTLPSAAEVWERFTKSVGMKAVAVSDVDSAQCLKLYEAMEYPFERQKPEEFPDALSLVALRRHAEENDLHVAIVTNDNGCLNYCKRTDRLYGFATIDGAMEALESLPHVLACVAKIPEARALLAGQEPLEALKNAVRHHLSEPVDLSYLKGPGGEVSDEALKDFVPEMVLLDPSTLSVMSYSESNMMVRCRAQGRFAVERYVVSTDESGKIIHNTVKATISIDRIVTVNLGGDWPIIKPSEVPVPKPKYKLAGAWWYPQPGC